MKQYKDKKRDLTYKEYKRLVEKSLIYTGRYNEKEAKEIVNMTSRQAYEYGINNNTIINLEKYNWMKGVPNTDLIK